MRINSRHIAVVLLLGISTLWPRILTAAQRTLPPPPPATQAMLNYVGLGGPDEYVFNTVSRNIKPIYPELVKLLPTIYGHYSEKEMALRSSRVTKAVYPILPEIQHMSGRQLQVVLLAVNYLAPFLDMSATGRKRIAVYGLHYRPYKDGGWLYDGDYLWRAWKADPESDLGKDAFLLLLETGFDPSYNCQFGSDNFLRVIHYAEPWLKAHPEDPRVIYVQFMLARAYHTWWVLGHDEVPTDRKYIPGSDAAYKISVAYYKQVIQKLSTLPKANYIDYVSQISSMIDVAQSELQRLENKQFDFTAFYCVPGA